MALETLDILPSLAGLDRRLAYQSQAPFTCADAMNVWPRDPIEGRMRIGSRPGLVKAFPTGVTGPVHLLANVRTIEGTAAGTQTHFLREFDFPRATGSSEWSTPSWIQRIPYTNRDLSYFPQNGSYALNANENLVPESANNHGLIVSGLQQETGAGSSYSITIQIMGTLAQLVTEPVTFAEWGSVHGTYSVFLRMDDNAPNVLLNGVVVEADFGAAGGNPRNLRLIKYVTVAGVTTETVLDSQPMQNQTVNQALRVLVENDTVTATAGGTSVTGTAPTAAGKRIGFGMGGRYDNPAFYSNASLLWNRVDYFRVEYTGSAPSRNRNVIVAAGGTNAGPGGTTVDLRFEDTPNTLIAPTAHALTNPAARQLQAAELLGKLYIVGEDASWSFDPFGAGTLASYSGPTASCMIVVAWRNRICVVPRNDEQNIEMSRVGDPTNWTFASLPSGISAVKLNTTGIDTGKLGEPINCLIPHSDDYLIEGCLSSMFVLRGDPTYGGQHDNLARVVGIVAPQAYARGPDGELVFLTTDGIYALEAGVQGYPRSVSREKLPQELRDVDAQNNRILLAFDVRNRGVFIGISPILGSGGKYFWLDWENKGFWPMEFNASHEPTALVFRNADSPRDQRLLLGCRDGHIRTFDDQARDDDGVPFRTMLLEGPIALGGSGYDDGILVEVVGQTGEESVDVDLEIQVGNSIESARKATPRKLFRFRAGKNLTHRPRLRGNAAFLRYSTSGNARWARENTTIVREKLGKQRLP